MTERERFRETLLFGQPDRIPFSPGGPRESTRAAWKAQGLENPERYMDALFDILGFRPDPPERPGTWLGVSFQMIPTFEEKVLEHRDGHYIVQDWMGAITEISDTYDYTYIRSAKDFVTRKWHKFPVETRADWEAMKARFDPQSAGRFPADFEARCERNRDRDTALGIHFNGPFWQLREWCGFEGLCLKMIEEPAFVAEMADFWADFVSATMRPILERVQLDYVGLSEDMAYKEHAMISPRMARLFLQPAYERWAAEIHASGCDIIDMDSDGYVGELIPLWIESGINVCDPIEVAAGNDIVAFRRAFGRRMAYKGGVDKRAIARGGDVIEAELERIRPVVEGGGFIPSCDHGVPPDISWEDFVHYARLLAELTGWR
ncbi:MAG TPA: uroporphyrinogen decarboxylase family protein [Planctomycetota bacterium]|nr:uroporphyrinogen decarboxylase family protein [Planctomycetota bacterium]HRR81493.1 uroporphyrinogen decarboxylase family protein [Planctomycetota bacterium]HRT94363.1 uroporphyrinogen decarboxylase family protein [Planctomycetota bacterium]